MEPEVKKTRTKTAKKEEPKSPPAPTFVIFRSVEQEPSQFQIRGAMASRCSDGRIEWEFNTEEAELVRRHAHITSGRIREV